MQTKLCKHDYSFDSPNIYISVYVYQGRRFAFDIGGVTIIIVIIYIAYFFIVCLTDSNYTIIILWTNNISIRALGYLKGQYTQKCQSCHHLLTQ